jgi:hypothetical protein
MSSMLGLDNFVLQYLSQTGRKPVCSLTARDTSRLALSNLTAVRVKMVADLCLVNADECPALIKLIRVK